MKHFKASGNKVG